MTGKEWAVNKVPPTPEPDEVVWRLPGGSAARSALLVLPHAGGNAHSYAQWRDYLPDDVLLLIGQYPGRGARFSEALPRQMSDLAGPIAASLPAGRRRPGRARAQHGLAGRLRGRPGPDRGRPSAAGLHRLRLPGALPGQPEPGPSRELLNDDELVAAIQSRGGTDDGILDEPELREILLPPIRADFAIDDAYR